MNTLSDGNLRVDEYKISGLRKVNILLGKNGVGKSTLLRKIQGAYQHADPTQLLTTSYITPERGGVLLYEPGIDHNIRSNPRWIPQERRKNQTLNFRQQTVAQFRDLQSILAQELEQLVENDGAPDKSKLFKRYVEKINTLLDQIEIRPDRKIFSIYKKGTDDLIDASQISSGESELIALAIEALVFLKEEDFNRPKVLLLDEPDVHLHPDLQVRFMCFLLNLADEGNFSIIIATHSTAILGATENFGGVTVAFCKSGQRDIEFEDIKGTYRKILPVFGAHPLSNIFNEAPILLVEGEDDERVWQTAVRRSRGTLTIYPCSVDGVPNMAEYERDVVKIMGSVYDNAKGYSIRDKDDTDGVDPSDEGPLIRFKLKCRAIENLMLTDEVLSTTNVGSWDALEKRIEAWIKARPEHPHAETMSAFASSGYDRQNFDLKNIRNILVAESGETKPWEILVGSTIASLIWCDETSFVVNNSIFTYLGEKLTKHLLPKSSD